MQRERYTDVSINLSIFLMKNVGLWEANNSTEARRRTLTTYCTILLGSLGMVVEFRDLYFSWDDINARLYVTCNILSVTMAMTKVISIQGRKVQFINLFLYMKDHFWNCRYDAQEKKILANCRKICILSTITVTCIGECALLAYVVTPIIANIGRNESDRILPFNPWLPLSMTPYYEMAFLFQVFVLYQVGLCYFCFDNAFCILSVHLATQFRILQYRFTKLCDSSIKSIDRNEKLPLTGCTDKSYEKFKDCVRQHQTLISFCKKLEDVYTLIILGQVVVFSVLICLFGYQILLADSTLARRSIFVFLLIGSTSLLFMFTYSCDGLIEQSDNVATAAYSAMWTQMPMNKAGRILRNDLMIVILRSRRVCCVTAYGFFPVSLATFTTILSTAMSYFTLLCNAVE